MHAEGSGDRKIEQLRRGGIGLHTAPIYLDTIELESTHDFSEKCGLLLIAFNEDAFQIGNDHTNWYGGKAGAGANVGEPTMAYGDLRDGKHAFAEVEAQNLSRVGDGGEGDLSIPEKQQVNVSANRFRELRS